MNLNAATPRRALVVDDDLLSRQMLADALRARGLTVAEAESADVGLRILSDDEPVDLIVSDLLMPHVDGAQFIEAVRALRVTGPAPLVIVVTGEVTSKLEMDLQQVGADAVLSKRLGAPLIAAAAQMLVSAVVPAAAVRDRKGDAA